MNSPMVSSWALSDIVKLVPGCKPIPLSGQSVGYIVIIFPSGGLTIVSPTLILVFSFTFSSSFEPGRLIKALVSSPDGWLDVVSQKCRLESTGSLTGFESVGFSVLLAGYSTE